ncbi:unnamed protein product, partial [Discosporangium mesarthrocarpum]
MFDSLEGTGPQVSSSEAGGNRAGGLGTEAAQSCQGVEGMSVGAQDVTEEGQMFLVPPGDAMAVFKENLGGGGSVGSAARGCVQLDSACNRLEGGEEGEAESAFHTRDVGDREVGSGGGGMAGVSSGDPFEERLAMLTISSHAGLHPYWAEHLRALLKPEARAMLEDLVPDNPLGYCPAASRRAGKANGSGACTTATVAKGSLLEYVLQQKELHPTKVLLIRVGEFYETYGVDAIMMMQHAGLNRMGNQVRAGCPRRNIQQTLDGLTGAGLTVAIFEEVTDVDAQRGPSKKGGIKGRVLAQVASPGRPNYLYEACLRTDDVGFRESKPYVGVAKASNGFTLCQIFVEEREVHVSERLTEEAVKAALEGAGAVEPVFEQDTGLLFLPDHTVSLKGLGVHDFPRQVLLRVAESLELDTEADLRQFQTVTRNQEGRPRPVYHSTATQIGLLPNPNVPDLVSTLLPPGYPAHSHRFLRRWLLTPPSYALADCAHQVCAELSRTKVSLPKLHPVPVGKAKTMLLAKQCNVPLFREISMCMAGMLAMLGESGITHSPSTRDSHPPPTLTTTPDTSVPAPIPPTSGNPPLGGTRAWTRARAGPGPGAGAGVGEEDGIGFEADPDDPDAILFGLGPEGSSGHLDAQTTEASSLLLDVAYSDPTLGRMGGEEAPLRGRALSAGATSAGEGEEVGEGQESAPGLLGPGSGTVMADNDNPYAPLVPHLLELVGDQSGIPADEVHLRERAQSVIAEINAVVAGEECCYDEVTSDTRGLVPESFFERNEGSFRGSISLGHEAITEPYAKLEESAAALCQAVFEDFPNAAQDLTYDLHNNSVFLKKRPPAAAKPIKAGAGESGK